MTQPFDPQQPFSPPPMPQPVISYNTGTGIPCPRCGARAATPVQFSWWGGIIGPKILHHVRCRSCNYAFNQKTGQSNTTGIVIYILISTVLILGLMGFAFVMMAMK